MMAGIVSDWRNYRQALKILAGFTLAASFFMPIKSCTRPVPPPGQGTSGGINAARETAVTEKEMEVYYPYKHFNASKIESWKDLSGFFWPLPFAFLQVVVRRRFLVKIFPFLGLTLVFWSYLTFFPIALFGKLEYGGHLARVSIVCLFLVYLSEAASICWAFIRPRIGFSRI